MFGTFFFCRNEQGGIELVRIGAVRNNNRSVHTGRALYKKIKSSNSSSFFIRWSDINY